MRSKDRKLPLDSAEWMISAVITRAAVFECVLDDDCLQLENGQLQQVVQQELQSLPVTGKPQMEHMDTLADQRIRMLDDSATAEAVVGIIREGRAALQCVAQACST